MMRKKHLGSAVLAFALALLLTLVPAGSALAAGEEAAEEAVEEVQAAPEEKSNNVMNVVLIVGVVAVIAIAATEIRRDNRRKESHG